MRERGVYKKKVCGLNIFEYFDFEKKIEQTNDRQKKGAILKKKNDVGYRAPTNLSLLLLVNIKQPSSSLVFVSCYRSIFIKCHKLTDPFNDEF